MVDVILTVAMVLGTLGYLVWLFTGTPIAEPKPTAILRPFRDKGDQTMYDPKDYPGDAVLRRKVGETADALYVARRDIAALEAKVAALESYLGVKYVPAQSLPVEAKYEFVGGQQLPGHDPKKRKVPDIYAPGTR